MGRNWPCEKPESDILGSFCATHPSAHKNPFRRHILDQRNATLEDAARTAETIPSKSPLRANLISSGSVLVPPADRQHQLHRYPKAWTPGTSKGKQIMTETQAEQCNIHLHIQKDKNKQNKQTNIHTHITNKRLHEVFANKPLMVKNEAILTSWNSWEETCSIAQ